MFDMTPEQEEAASRLVGLTQREMLATLAQAVAALSMWTIQNGGSAPEYAREALHECGKVLDKAVSQHLL